MEAEQGSCPKTPVDGLWSQRFLPERSKRYERLKRIGGGAFGDIHELWDTWRGRRLAGKTVRLAGAYAGLPMYSLRRITDGWRMCGPQRREQL